MKKGRVVYKVVPEGNDFLIVFADPEARAYLLDFICVKGPSWFTRTFRSKKYVKEVREARYNEAQDLAKEIWERDYE